MNNEHYKNCTCQECFPELYFDGLSKKNRSLIIRLFNLKTKLPPDSRKGENKDKKI